MTDNSKDNFKGIDLPRINAPFPEINAAEFIAAKPSGLDICIKTLEYAKSLNVKVIITDE